MAEAFGGGIDRQHLAAASGSASPSGFGQDHELARRHLAAVVEAHRPGDQQRLADGDGAVEKRLAGPDALEHAALVPQHRVKHPQPAPRREDALGHDPADAGHLLAHLGLGERRHGRCVDIAVGEMPEQIARGADAEPRELLGAPLADAFEELDGGVEADGAGAARSGGIVARQDGLDAVGLREQMLRESLGIERLEIVHPSPTPMKRIGSPSSRRSATTAPPRALPSSLVTTMPGRGHRLRQTACPAAPRSGPRCRRAPATSRAARPGSSPADDPDDLSQLLHQPFLGVQPAGGVDDDGVEPAGDGGVDRVERHRGGIAARRAGHARHASRSAQTWSWAMAPAR